MFVVLELVSSLRDLSNSTACSKFPDLQVYSNVNCSLLGISSLLALFFVGTRVVGKQNVASDLRVVGFSRFEKWYYYHRSKLNGCRPFFEKRWSSTHPHTAPTHHREKRWWWSPTEFCLGTLSLWKGCVFSVKFWLIFVSEVKHNDRDLFFEQCTFNVAESGIQVFSTIDEDDRTIEILVRTEGAGVFDLPKSSDGFTCPHSRHFFFWCEFEEKDLEEHVKSALRVCKLARAWTSKSCEYRLPQFFITPAIT